MDRLGKSCHLMVAGFVGGTAIAAVAVGDHVSVLGWPVEDLCQGMPQCGTSEGALP